jgi:CRISPR-associated endonuclease Cas2
MIRYAVTYDIADDACREDVAALLSGYGPRVQLSVFECDLRSRREAAALRSKLRELIAPVEDQVRPYSLQRRKAQPETEGIKTTSAQIGEPVHEELS